MTVRGLDAIRKRAVAGQPMKAWTYYHHHNMWDGFKPFVQEAHDDRLELLALLDRLPAYEAAVEALESLIEALEYDPGSTLGGKIAVGRGALAELQRKAVPA